MLKIKATFLSFLLVMGTCGGWATEVRKFSPEIVIQNGHLTGVRALSLSPSGSYGATGSKEGTIILWDLKSGSILRTLNGHTGSITSLVFSPDGSALASSSSDKTIKLWNPSTGKVLKTFMGHGAAVNQVVFTPDGLSIISCSDDKTIRFWDLKNNQNNKVVVGHPAEINALDISRDGKFLLTGSNDKSIKLWDAKTGTLISQFTGPLDMISSVKFAPDGQTFASCCGALNGMNPRDPSISIWDRKRASAVRVFRNNSVWWNNSLAFSPDGQMLVSTSGAMDGGDGASMAVIVWDIYSGMELANLRGHSDDVTGALFLPDGQHVISCSMDFSIRVWDLVEKKETATLQKKQHTYPGFFTDPDTGSIACYDSLNDRNIQITRINSLDPSYLHKSSPLVEPGLTNGMAFDHGIAYYMTPDNAVQQINLGTGELQKQFKDSTAKLIKFYIGNSGKTLITIHEKKAVKLWDLASGKLLKTLTMEWDPYGSWVSPDGLLAVVGGTVWNLDTGKPLLNKKFEASRYGISAKTMRLVGGTGHEDSTGNETLDVWDLKTGNLIWNLTKDSYSIRELVLSPDGTKLLSYAEDGVLKLWDLDTGKEWQNIKGSVRDVQSTAFTNDGKVIMVTSIHGHLMRWLVATGELLTTTKVEPSGEWITWTPDGYFTGTEWATRHLVHIVDGFEIMDIGQVFETFYRPDLVSARALGQMNSQDSQTINLSTLLEKNGKPPVVEILLAPTTPIQDRNIHIRLRVSDQGGGIGKVNLYNNGSLVTILDGGSRGIRVSPQDAPGSSAYEFEALLTLRAGENTISATAFNKSNTVESQQVSAVYQVGTSVVTKPSLYILAVAVQKYRDRDLQLKYTVDDAKALTAFFEKEAGHLYQKVHVVQLFDEAVTRDGFSQAFDNLGLQVQPDDVFVLYLAGHGVTNDKDGEYYFLPVNFRFNGLNSFADQGISKDDIQKNMVKICAQKSLVLFDTCNSGSFLKGPKARGLAEKTAVDRLMKGAGRAMIVASAGDQVALEGYENHGVFTYAILKALAGAADFGNTGYVTIKGLSIYVENNVPNFTFNKWGYEQVPQSWLPAQDFPLVGLEKIR